MVPILERIKLAGHIPVLLTGSTVRVLLKDPAPCVLLVGDKVIGIL